MANSSFFRFHRTISNNWSLPLATSRTTLLWRRSTSVDEVTTGSDSLIATFLVFFAFPFAGDIRRLCGSPTVAASFAYCLSRNLGVYSAAPGYTIIGTLCLRTTTYSVVEATWLRRDRPSHGQIMSEKSKRVKVVIASWQPAIFPESSKLPDDCKLPDDLNDQNNCALH